MSSKKRTEGWEPTPYCHDFADNTIVPGDVVAYFTQNAKMKFGLVRETYILVGPRVGSGYLATEKIVVEMIRRHPRGVNKHLKTWKVCREANFCVKISEPGAEKLREEIRNAKCPV